MRNTIAFAALAAALACGGALPAAALDVSGARDASAKFAAAMASGDAQTAASFLADDAVILPPGRTTLTGKANAQRFLGNMARVVKNLKYTPEDVTPIGDAGAREIGTFAFKLRDNDVDGKYMFVWTKVGSDWKLSAEMWNRSTRGNPRAARGGNGGNGFRGGNGANGANGANGVNGANGANGNDGPDEE